MIRGEGSQVVPRDLLDVDIASSPPRHSHSTVEVIHRSIIQSIINQSINQSTNMMAFNASRKRSYRELDEHSVPGLVDGDAAAPASTRSKKRPMDSNMGETRSGNRPMDDSKGEMDESMPDNGLEVAPTMPLPPSTDDEILDDVLEDLARNDADIETQGDDIEVEPEDDEFIPCPDDEPIDGEDALDGMIPSIARRRTRSKLCQTRWTLRLAIPILSLGSNLLVRVSCTKIQSNPDRLSTSMLSLIGCLSASWTNASGGSWVGPEVLTLCGFPAQSSRWPKVSGCCWAECRSSMLSPCTYLLFLCGFRNYSRRRNGRPLTFSTFRR